MSNALRYTREGGILLACRQRSGHLQIEVWDTGIGIPADRLEDIFVEFHRIDPVSDDAPGGVGLGLAIVRQTAHLLDHRIQVCSRVGHGSMFAIMVPLAALPVAGAVWTDVSSMPDQPAANSHGAVINGRTDSIAC